MITAAKDSLRYSSTFYKMLWMFRCITDRKLVRDSTEEWRKSRNIYTGRRGFIIGNGPSLLIKDLERLKGEITIASNKIYLAFAETEWRPTFYTCADKLVWKKVSGELHKHVPLAIIMSTMNANMSSVPVTTIRHLGGIRSAGDSAFSLDCSLGAYGGRTVTYINMQIAAHLGLNPIYLIGCDHYYHGEEDQKRANDIVVHTGRKNHFSEKYRNEGERVNFAPISEMNIAFDTAHRVACRNGVKIVNATRGGHLECFPREDIETLL